MPDQYKIPQNIEIEDKIFGPFTLRQFLYMIGGGISVYFLFLTLGRINVIAFLAIALPIAFLTLALVFLKINERPFLTFLGYFFVFIKEPKIKKWEKSVKIKSIMTQSKEEAEQSRKITRKSVKEGLVRSRLEELAMIVDTKGWSAETEEIEILGRITSTPESSSIVKTTLKAEGPLEDVFGDLEAAMERLTAEKERGVKEEDFSDLAAKLSGLISRK